MIPTKLEKNQKKILVNLGCGPVQPKGWINVDYSNRAKLVKYFSLLDRFLTKIKLIPPTEFSKNTTVFDVEKPLPFSDSSIRAFFSGELWEHLLPPHAQALTRECFRCLIPGGHLRVTVPDNYEFWKHYCAAHEEVLNKPRNLWDDEYTTHYIGEFFEYVCTSKILFGSIGHYHKWAYDEVSLILQLERAGFVKIQKRKFQDSNIPDIESVEKRTHLSIEGIKTF